MRYTLILLCLFAVACGGGQSGDTLPDYYSSVAADPAPAAAPRVVYGPVQPGQGQEAVTAAGPDEVGSWYLWSASGARSLVVGHDRTQWCPTNATRCTPNTYRELPEEHCASSVTTRVCSFDARDSAPRDCRTITLAVDQTATVPISGAYAGVEMVAGLCLDGTRESSGIPTGRQWWRFPDGRIEDMGTGGGSPHPGTTTWYVHPTGGPR